MSKNAIKIHIDLNEPAIAKKLTNDRFGRYVSLEWKRLIDPYTPRDTGMLIENYELLPFGIHYKETYSSRVYYNPTGANFKTDKSKYATDHWDIKAAQAGQLDKLYRTVNSALKNGNY